jgi:hypothetical protein
MGVIDETAQWVATVYQIETGDPANGGPDAPDNVQARALADRTLYLKNEVEALEASVAGIDLSVFLATANLLTAMKAVDGAGSGLDADLLDGLHASAFARTSDLTGLLATANLLTAMKAVDGAGSGLDADLLDGLHASAFARTSDLTGLLATANLLTAMKAVDGAGSGLDADLLDGLHASAFARTSDLTGLLATADLQYQIWLVDGAGSWIDADLLDGMHASAFSTFGIGQTWQNVTGQRSHNVLYMNTTGAPIAVACSLNDGVVFQVWDGSQYTYSWTSDVDTDQGSFGGEITIPPGWGYRIGGSGAGHTVWELR